MKHDVSLWRLLELVNDVKWIVMFIFLIMVTAAWALPVPLTNPGAEQANGEVPAGVDTWKGNRVTACYARDTQIKHGGKASFYIRVEDADPQSDSRSATYIFTGPLAAGLHYTATAWIKTRDAVDAGFSLRTKSATGAWLDTYPATCDRVTGTTDWTLIRCTWTATPGMAQFVLFLNVRIKGEAWFDDLEIHDDFEAPAQVKTFTRQCEQLNRLTTDLSNWPDGFGKSLASELLTRLMALKNSVNAYERKLAAAMQAGDVPVALRQERSQLSHQMSVALLGAQRLDGLAQAVKAEGGEQSECITGWSDSMTHVFLRDCPFSWQYGKPGYILAVKGETEAIQLVLLPLARDLKQVKVSALPLKSRSGDVLAADTIAIHPVGFVKTTVAPTDRLIPVEREYQGWWPDLLLDNFAFEVQRNDTQPVWISIKVPTNQPTGVYRGAIKVQADSGFTRDVPLSVEVADLYQPDVNPWALRNMMSFHEPRAQKYYGERWTPDMQRKYFDFLLDHRVNVSSTYGIEDYETVENMKRFAARGQNVFKLDWYNQDGRVIKSNAAKLRQRLNLFYPVMKGLGYLDRAFVYGWDEMGEPQDKPDIYQEVRFAADILAKEFPGIRLLSAGTDRSYGANSPLKGLSNLAFCPQMKYDAAAARQAQAAGNQVWWYDVTWTIDQPLIRGRMIAWQTFKLGADGFLIWTLNRWKANDKFINNTVLADYWNPTLDGGYENSSALYVYPGADGPISSLRLENFRDGSEDYGLLMEARKRLAATTDKTARRLLQEAIAVEDDLARDLRTFADDPSLLRRHRERLIRALERSAAISDDSSLFKRYWRRLWSEAQ